MTQTANAGIFKIEYELLTRADPDSDIQFGMDFTITQSPSSNPLPLCQLIFPATSVGTNKAGQWNIDNHKAPSADPACLIFANAEGGTIKDTPRELSKRDRGVLSTKFTVYRVDVKKDMLQIHGVKFGYSINTSDTKPQTIFTGFSTYEISNEEKKVVLEQCKSITFS
ncbi:hypothetical protein [Rhizobium straminoryzae]|uniref:Uncharacterized protein n=1 Tax=Rhizobium straminoryzae TaxID=1387186 RepID=A0A549TFV2_9HYPH|nr:hypothetical protein [Rhizobium straminoryzae]TRL41482.1 hypothetical protein FNA46_03585 [Rhizobium straminoryzae]